jgi:GntR family transcriptional regulator, transcriptional repressor for pyruvate dehydrogenase complex
MAIELEPLLPTSRVDGIAERLRTLILTGAYPAGSRLPNERELAGALGVNRGSVREALRRLEFLELVEVRHGQGSFVREVGGSSALQVVEALLRDRRTITVALLRQLLEFRRDVSTRVVELAALRRSDAQVERARRLLERERACAGNPAEALRIDLELNALLGEATGNLMYQLVTNLFTRLVERLGPLYYHARRDHLRSLETHARLLGAIEARDPALAHSILEQMLDYSEAAILREVERLEAQGLIGPEAPAS